MKIPSINIRTLKICNRSTFGFDTFGWWPMLIYSLYRRIQNVNRAVYITSENTWRSTVWWTTGFVEIRSLEFCAFLRFFLSNEQLNTQKKGRRMNLFALCCYRFLRISQMLRTQAQHGTNSWVYITLAMNELRVLSMSTCCSKFYI